MKISKTEQSFGHFQGASTEILQDVETVLPLLFVVSFSWERVHVKTSMSIRVERHTEGLGESMSSRSEDERFQENSKIRAGSDTAKSSRTRGNYS